jgi:hypothetical protein
MFSAAAFQVQTHTYLQRPNWQAVARALGPTTVTRAILAGNGTTANPLKLYLPHVNWVQPQSQKVRIGEIDVVGNVKRLALRPVRIVLPNGTLRWRTPMGKPVPSYAAPRGTRLVVRFRVANWIVARFVLDRPRRLSVRQLLGLAPHYFLRTPRDMLIFYERPGH